MSTNRLRFGVYLPPFGPFGDPRVLVDVARRAEAAGWDGMFLWDHVVSEATPIADPWTALGAIALATQRMLVGPTVTPLPRRRPWVVARQAATVSRLSAGRLVLGVGLGSDEAGDFRRFGEPTGLAERASMLTESLDIIRAMWAGAAIRHHGPHYEVLLDGAAAEPHGIPIWMASSTSSPAVLRRAAACDGIFAHRGRTMTPDDVAALVSALDGFREVDRARPYDIAIAGNASDAWETPNPDHADLLGLEDAGATWWMESLMHFDPLEQSLAIVDAGPPGTGVAREPDGPTRP